MNTISQEAKKALIEALKERFKKFNEPYAIRKHLEHGFEEALSIIESFPTSEPENHCNKDASFSIEDECIANHRNGNDPDGEPRQ